MSEKKTELQTERRTLRYDFTAVETHDLSMALANKTKEKLSIEEEKKAISSQYKAKLDEVSATINKLSNQITDGYEMRDTDVEIEYHKPENGRKTLTRKDTGYSWHERMEAWEFICLTSQEKRVKRMVKKMRSLN